VGKDGEAIQTKKRMRRDSDVPKDQRRGVAPAAPQNAEPCYTPTEATHAIVLSVEPGSLVSFRGEGLWHRGVSIKTVDAEAHLLSKIRAKRSNATKTGQTTRMQYDMKLG
jgi:hypothetical protein